jgi:hypothetical protein
MTGRIAEDARHPPEEQLAVIESGISTWLFVPPSEKLSIALLSYVPTAPVGAFLQALEQ